MNKVRFCIKCQFTISSWPSLRMCYWHSAYALNFKRALTISNGPWTKLDHILYSHEASVPACEEKKRLKPQTVSSLLMWVSLCRMGGPRASKAQRISTLQARDCTLDRRELLLYYIALASFHYIVLAIFIGPESDHWQCLSVTDSLTHSLLFGKLDWCDPGVWRCLLKTCRGCYCCLR